MTVTELASYRPDILQSPETTSEAELFDAAGAHRLAEMVFEHFAPYGADDGRPELCDSRDQSPRFMMHRTDSGLYLDMFNGVPSRILTRWGEWEIAYGDSREPHLEASRDLLRRLWVGQVNEPFQLAPGVEMGPLYAVGALDGEYLLTPKLSDDIPYPYTQSRLAASWQSVISQFGIEPLAEPVPLAPQSAPVQSDTAAA